MKFRYRRTVYALLFAILSLAMVGIVMGQGAPGTSFTPVRQIGRVRPEGIRYDPNFDRMVMVDPMGRLLLVNATDFGTQFTLHDGGLYNDYRFSHNGRWLALAIERRVELWNTQEGTLIASIEPEGALSVTAPLHFSDDDSFLYFNAVVPAPDNIRQSENDTTDLAWLWDLAAARDEARSRLINGVEAYAFFDYRFGFVFGPNNVGLGALPGRLQVIDANLSDLPIVAEIEMNRFERDPMSIWYSLRGEQIYIQPNNQSNLLQMNTENLALVDIPLGYPMDYLNIRRVMGGLIPSDQARIIGEAQSLRGNSFLRLLLGEDYRVRWEYHPLTVTLIDILNPITLSSDQWGLLVYVLDEETGRGTVEFARPFDTFPEMALHPDGIHLAVRRTSGLQAVEVYNLQTGALERSYYPGLRHADGDVLAFDGTGEVLIAGFQRFDVQTGETLYQDLSYHEAFEFFYFTDDSRQLVTINGPEWLLWDIATGEMIRRENFALGGVLLQTSPDGHRFLTAIDTASGPGIEILEVGMDERHRVIFETLPDRGIENVIPSPNWENFLVIYTANSYSQHYPGNEVAVYNIDRGKLWFFAGDDLPHPEGRSYGWLDDDTAYVRAESYGGPDSPERIYGLEYHVSGLPACLVEAFPDDWTRWLDVWERFNVRLRPDVLGRTAQRLCAALEDADAPADIDVLLTPTPTPTPIVVTPRPSVIAGVPACLTQAFPDQALDYADAWRRMTEGLTAEQIANFEALLCEGINDGSYIGYNSYGFSDAGPIAEVMTIDVETGRRSVGTFVPQQPQDVPAMDLILNEFYRTEGFTPNGSVLSPDRQLLAAFSPSGHITIYRLLTSYDALASTATGILQATITNLPNSISVRPTSTPPFDLVGGPRPTLTPTVTPTSPPPASATADMPGLNQVEDVCLEATRAPVSDPPPGYAPPGFLLVTVPGDNRTWTLDPMTGHLAPDERIPRCGTELSCDFSFNRDWILTYGENITVSRPDGSDAQALFEARELEAWPLSFQWLDLETLQYAYEGYLPDHSFALTLLQRYDPETRQYTEPVPPPTWFRINDLDVEIVSEQPGSGRFVVVRMPFNTGHSTGYRYYIYDRDTGEADYFARLADYSVNSLELVWHPLGTALYYRYPVFRPEDEDTWYIFDPATGEHRFLGELPGGEWSRDGRSRIRVLALRYDDIQALLEAGRSLPWLAIWDGETGLTRRYCIPTETDSWSVRIEPIWTATPTISPSPTRRPDEPIPYVGINFAGPPHWSPDNRYVAFLAQLTNTDTQREPVRTLILDTETGSVLQLSAEVGSIIVWTGSAPEVAE